MFSQANGQLTPIVVEAPGGGFNPEFNNIFAGNLGFGPPPPGAQPMPPRQQMGGGPQPNHDVGAGRFDLGGGQQLRVKINGQTPENFVKNKVSGMIWGWIIGAVIIGLMVIIGLGFGIYIWYQAKQTTAEVNGTAAPTAAKWDGKTPFTCGGSEIVSITGVTASAGISAGGSCKLTLVGVNITAPVGIDTAGAATVTMSGGSVTSSSMAVNATGASHVIFAGTKVTGKVNKAGAATVVGN